jgi:hypothetical protein
MKTTYDWLPSFVGGEAEWIDNGGGIWKGRIETFEAARMDKRNGVKTPELKVVIHFSFIRIRRRMRDGNGKWEPLEKGLDQKVVMEFIIPDISDGRDSLHRIERTTSFNELVRFAVPHLNTLEGP